MVNLRCDLIWCDLIHEVCLTKKPVLAQLCLHLHYRRVAQANGREPQQPVLAVDEGLDALFATLVAVIEIFEIQPTLSEGNDWEWLIMGLNLCREPRVFPIPKVERNSVRKTYFSLSKGTCLDANKSNLALQALSFTMSLWYWSSDCCHVVCKSCADSLVLTKVIQ